MSNLLPLRLRPLPIGIAGGGVRTSISRWPVRRDASTSAGTLVSRVFSPLMISSPVSIASTNAAIQLSLMTPPWLATPITSERAPAARASSGDSRGNPVLTVQPAIPSSPTQRSAAQSARPKAVFA